MHIPTGNFPIIDSINQILSSNDITSSKNMRFISILHGMSIDNNFIVLSLNQSFNRLLFILRAKSTDNIIRFYHNFFIGEFIFFSIEEILLELYTWGYSILFYHSVRSEIWYEIYSFINWRGEYLVIGSHIVESSSEDNCHLFGSYSQGWSGTIKSGITNAENYHMTFELIYFLFAFG